MRKLLVVWLISSSLILGSCSEQSTSESEKTPVVQTQNQTIASLSDSGIVQNFDSWTVLSTVSSSKQSENSKQNEYTISDINAHFTIPEKWLVDWTGSAAMQLKTDGKYINNTVRFDFPVSGEIPETELELVNFVWEIVEKANGNGNNLCQEAKSVLRTRFKDPKNSILSCNVGKDGKYVDLEYTFNYIAESTKIGRIYITGNKKIPGLFVSAEISQKSDGNLNKMDTPEIQKIKDFFSTLTFDFQPSTGGEDMNSQNSNSWGNIFSSKNLGVAFEKGLLWLDENANIYESGSKIILWFRNQSPAWSNPNYFIEVFSKNPTETIQKSIKKIIQKEWKNPSQCGIVDGIEDWTGVVNPETMGNGWLIEYYRIVQTHENKQFLSYRDNENSNDENFAEKYFARFDIYKNKQLSDCWPHSEVYLATCRWRDGVFAYLPEQSKEKFLYLSPLYCDPAFYDNFTITRGK